MEPLRAKANAFRGTFLRDLNVLDGRLIAVKNVLGRAEGNVLWKGRGTIYKLCHPSRGRGSETLRQGVTTEEGIQKSEFKCEETL